jgi:hypothetical protein
MAQSEQRLSQDGLQEAYEQARKIIEAREQAQEKGFEAKKEVLSEPEKEAKQRLIQETTRAELPQEIQKQAETKAVQTAALEPKQQLEQLVGLAFEKGPAFAVETARRLNDPFILDALHDTLAKNQLYQKLTQTGKI